MSDEKQFMLRQDPMRVAAVLTKTCLALGMNHGHLANVMECSRRTVSRWALEGVRLPRTQLVALAGLATGRDASLAAEIAALAGETLVSLGLAEPAQSVQPLVRHKLMDAVVCAAAEALDVSPRAIRPGLLAAVRCAREVGLTLEAMEGILAAGEKSRLV